MIKLSLITPQEINEMLSDIPEDKELVIFTSKIKADENISRKNIKKILASWDYLFCYVPRIFKFNDDMIESIGYINGIPDL